MLIGSKMIALRREAERNVQFPEAPQIVWSRKASKGFTTLPRILPLILRIQDALSVGSPVSSTYTDLVFRVFDEQYLVLESPHERALFAGFTGPRAVTTWSGRMRRLVELGFVMCKAGTKGEFHHTLIVDPYFAAIAIQQSDLGRHVDKDLWDALHQRCREVGAIEPPSPPSVPPLPPAPPRQPPLPLELLAPAAVAVPAQQKQRPKRVRSAS